MHLSQYFPHFDFLDASDLITSSSYQKKFSSSKNQLFRIHVLEMHNFKPQRLRLVLTSRPRSLERVGNEDGHTRFLHLSPCHCPTNSQSPETYPSSLSVTEVHALSPFFLTRKLHGSLTGWVKMLATPKS